MEDELSEELKRAGWLLSSIKHAAMATVNEDGSPHNTPYFFMISAELTELYWGSHPESIHSHNILRNGSLYVVLYESNAPGGLYIRANRGRIAENNELQRALEHHNSIREKSGKAPLLRDYYQTSSPQRMWIADTQQFWVHDTEKDEDGLVIRDTRFEVYRSQLI